MIRARFYVGSGPNVLASDFEARAESALDVLAELHVSGATVYPALGYWEGTTEQSLVVELIEPVFSVASGDVIARALAERFRQQVVLWVRDTIAARMIKGGSDHG